MRFLTPLLVLAFFTACTAKSPAPVIQGEGDAAVLARLDGQPITEGDVRAEVGGRLSRAELDLFEVREDGINQVVETRLLEAEAAKRGVSKDDLVQKEVLAKVEISDKEIEKFFNENKGRFSGKKLDEVKGNIRSFLFRGQHEEKYGELIASLKKKADLEVLIKAPTVRVEVPDDAPGIGPKDAPVQLVEFTDYQCPFCGRARPAINKVLEEYKGKVRYILMDFPLSFHKDAQKAHEAAHCAGDQDKYWDLNKKLFSAQRELGVDKLKGYAREIKLNQSKFDECLDSGKYADRVQAGLQKGTEVGVSGTPAFFVNGRMISGARPFEDFQAAIERELSRN